MKKNNMKEILNTQLEIPEIVNEKIEASYQILGLQSERKITHFSRRKWLPVAAAVAMVAATSIGVLAANGFFSKEVVESGETLSYEFEMNYELTPYEVEVTPGYIPDGYIEVEQGKYDKEGFRQNGISICGINSSWLGQQSGFLDVENLKDMEKTMIGGMEAHLLTLDYDTDRIARTFDKRIYLFNPSDGYVVVLYGGNDISMEELKNVAGDLTIKVDPETPLEYASEEEIKLQEEADKKWETEMIELYHAGVASERIFSLGDSFVQETLEGEIEYNFTESKLLDNVSEIEGYNTKGYFQYEDVSPWIASDGTLKDYERVTYQKDEDGEVDLSTGKTETVQQKFLVVKGSMKNVSDAVTEGWANGNIVNLDPNGNGSYAFDKTFTEAYVMDTHRFADGPQYFDKSQYQDDDSDARSHFFFYELQPGEEVEFTLMWIVDGDRTENQFIEVNHTGMDGESIYITTK